MAEPRKLERGMLLLDPETYSTPHLWTVATVGAKSAKVIAHYGTCWADAKLSTSTVPDGWTVVENTKAAALLARAFQGDRAPTSPSRETPVAIAANQQRERPS